MSETTTFKPGDRVLVAKGADDVWFDFDGPTFEGVVVEASPEDSCAQYNEERRVNVREADGQLTQYVRPEDLTLITSDN